MAKHPHKLLFINNQTWKCVLEGCSFFVHRGLQHVLIGKHAVCWECEEIFVIDDIALRNAKPTCIDCRMITKAQSIPDAPLSNNQETTTSERTPEQQQAYENLMTEMFGKNWRSKL